MKTIKILFCCIPLLTSACGGGGGGSSNATPETPVVTILNVNKNGLNFTAPYASAINTTQNSTSGYFVSVYMLQEWSGSNFGYTSGYVNPTSGTLQSYSVTDKSTNELAWRMSNLNYNVALTPPSVDGSALPLAALAASSETKIYGGSNNDRTLYLVNTSEVDLSSGNDTLVHSQIYSAYQFQRVPGQNTSIYVTRSGHQSLVKNVENFEFADITKTFTEIIATLP
jgi:hypothetical protein